MAGGARPGPSPLYSAGPASRRGAVGAGSWGRLFWNTERGHPLFRVGLRGHGGSQRRRRGQRGLGLWIFSAHWKFPGRKGRDPSPDIPRQGRLQDLDWNRAEESEATATNTLRHPVKRFLNCPRVSIAGISFFLIRDTSYFAFSTLISVRMKRRGGPSTTQLFKCGYQKVVSLLRALTN